MSDSNQYIKPNLKLRDFQRQAIDFLFSKNRGLLALPTGTGKTITAFSTYALLKANNPKLKLIYITEKPLIHQTINQDLRMYFNFNTSAVYNNTKTQRVSIYNQWADFNDILIINYASLRIDFNDIGFILSKRNDIEFMTIFDEATNFKNPKSQIAQSIKLLCNASVNSYAMSATPASRSLMDIYNILNTIGIPPYKSKAEFDTLHADYETRKMFLFRIGEVKAMGIARPSECGNYQELYISLRKKLKLSGEIALLTQSALGKFTILNSHNASFKWSVKNAFYGKTTLLILHNNKKVAVQVSIFDDKSSVGYKNLKLFALNTKDSMFIKAKNDIAKELPPIIITMRYTDEDDYSKQAIKGFYQSNKVVANKMEIATQTPQAFLENIPKDYKTDKIQRVVDFIKNDLQDDKVIIYYPYTTTLNILRDILTTEFDSYIAYFTGETKDGVSEVKRFLSDKNCQILLASDTILRGHNIQQINHIIALQPPYTAENIIQLVGRINRIGGTNEPKFLHYFLNKNTRDEDIFTALNAQLKHIKQINPKLVENGIIYNDNSEITMSENQARAFLDKQINERKVLYI